MRFKNATGVDTLDFTKKTELANLKSDVDNLDIDNLKNVPSGLNTLKSKVDKLDIGKLETTLVDLSKLSNVVKNDVVEKTEYDELAKKKLIIRIAQKNTTYVKKTIFGTLLPVVVKKESIYQVLLTNQWLHMIKL